MSISIGYRPLGPTVALSVTASAHTPVAVLCNVSEQPYFAGLLNTGALPVYVSLMPLSQTGAAPALTGTNTPVFPVDGTSTSITNGILLPPLMEIPILIAAPTGFNGFAITAIASGAGPTIIYVAPFTRMT